MRKTLTVMVLIAIVMISSLYAEMAPEVYEGMKRNAPEQLIVKVRSVRTGGGFFSRVQSVEAKVEIIEVFASETRLSAGDRITIRYEVVKRNPAGWAGPRSPSLLKRNEETFAFLAWDSEQNCYVLAARGASFEMPAPQR